MSTPATPTDMITALVRLREALQAAHLPLDLPDVEKRRKEQREMIDPVASQFHQFQRDACAHRMACHAEARRWWLAPDDP